MKTNFFGLAVLFALFSTQSPTFGQEAGGPALKILEAVYGDLPDGNHEVVTEKVAKLVKDNKLQLEAGNDLFGDPAEQVGKKLRVKYELGGKALEATVEEGETMMLPAPKLVGELKILTAKYGELPNGQFEDVLATIKRYVKENRLEITANNDTLGDPAPGVFKRLRVEYQIGEIKLAKSVYENNKLVIAPPAKEVAKDKEAGKESK